MEPAVGDGYSGKEDREEQQEAPWRDDVADGLLFSHCSAG